MHLTRNMALAVVAIGVAVVVTGGFYAFQISTSEEVAKLTWQRTGGFIGLDEELVIEADGSALYVSNRFGDAEMVLEGAEVKDLLDKANFLKMDRVYSAKPGVADHFTYRLTVQTTSGVKTVEWVDDWASEETLPTDLGVLQIHIEDIIKRMHQQTGASQEADERAIRIAKNFIVQAPTFKFDGIPGTLEVGDVIILESFPPQYKITITFDSRHAGYGDRTGQALAQVITPHTAIVTVVNDNVISAILDNQWDELNQEPRR